VIPAGTTLQFEAIGTVNPDHDPAVPDVNPANDIIYQTVVIQP